MCIKAGDSVSPGGGLSAVVFDWADPVVDFGSRAPMGAVVELVASQGVETTIAEARVERRMAASARLSVAKPDYCIDTVAELPAIIDAINRRLADGERPAPA